MYVDINQCQSVVANFPNDIESIFVFGIFLCRQQNFFLYYLKKFLVSDENIFEKIYQLGRNGYVDCLPLYLPPFFCKKKMTSASNAEVISFTKQFRQCRGRTSFPINIISL